MNGIDILISDSYHPISHPNGVDNAHFMIDVVLVSRQRTSGPFMDINVLPFDSISVNLGTG
jgi:hypothetical protein